MTEFVPFVPTPQGPVRFQATLVGLNGISDVYNVVVTWNTFGQRWYINIYTSGGDLVVAKALVASPTGINLQALTWASGSVVATTIEPHGYAIGAIVLLTIAGALPDSLNGVVAAYMQDAFTFTYVLATDPGLATAFGTATYNVSLTAGYFVSTLIFRQLAQQFEIST